MAPSATTELITPESKVGVAKQPEKHVHGAEDKSPLEAISHGPITHPGEISSFLWALYHHSIPRYLQSTPPGIPTFSSHAEHRQHILIHTAAVFRDFSRKGFTEGMSGHISVRDPEFPEYIWMNPLGKHFGLMTAGDLICLDVNSGKIVGGNRVFITLSSA
jgi:hypothetical protein